MPERERVAGVEPAVGELVDGVERERVERVELPHAREVEEPVAADLAGDVPEQEPEHGAGDEDPAAARNPLRPRSARARTRPRRPPAASSSTSVSVSDEPTANVTASAPKISASDQASVAATLRSPSARATSAPGQRTARRWRARAGRASSLEQLRHPRRREPVGRLAVHPAALAAEEEAAQPQSRRAAASAPARRSASPRCFDEEAQVPAHVLAEQPAAVRRAADVHALGVRGRRAPSSPPRGSGRPSPSPR